MIVYSSEDGTFPCLSSVDSFVSGCVSASGWQQRPDLNFARTSFGGAVAAGRLYAVPLPRPWAGSPAERT